MKHFNFISLFSALALFFCVQNTLAQQKTEEFAPVSDLRAEAYGSTVFLHWTPPYDNPMIPLSESFESGIPAIWKTIDADGDGYNWMHLTNFTGQSGLCVSSASYIGGVGALTPDNYLITPELKLPTDALVEIIYWVCTQDLTAPSEHYAVYSSSTGNNAADFVNLLYEETLTAKRIQSPELIRGNRTQGVWYQRKVVLPNDTKYVAFRHFNSTDNFWLNLDEVSILYTPLPRRAPCPHPGGYTYSVFRDGQKIASGLSALAYIDTDVPYGTQDYCVQVNYLQGDSYKVCKNIVVANSANIYGADKPFALTVVGKTIVASAIKGEITLYDIRGRLIASGCDTLRYKAENGFYLIKIQVNGTVYTEKIQIQ
ncbi:hypothetical protein HMPREF1990_00582 [Porphyromonas gingivalis W4087]|uniref:Cleaved adhesin domain-containing protein n=2 Tax=Porphyromonas gingivalis TaxID=837 RepID=A0A0E2LQ58_PORGN|nr:choice-of-anchor J domain-containing protein [Porphyromonas gingivalis]ATS07393.1 hemagglutinin [Porphyromonas gingivalis]ERJ65492.1 hypothetical protein HMPREF1555_01387 [Porphyromonas gingivalis F0570]ERJ67009.1 hypothetical protein HMPREF1553_01635 [Porphyromonas gingivalis F0568]ERJ87429.1 hypothetical protein HMPREF1989_00675 [Porphyromonas gingivalis F0566]ERJ90326.1 hypothetical protein HMPREF1990_00582 [Porphyromonas gingivalis W4087]